MSTIVWENLPDGVWPCPQGCGGLTEDPYGGPCQACWDAVPTSTDSRCDVCNLPDPYRGQGDGIGSCDCPRCDCGEAMWSSLCSCPPDDEYHPDDLDDWEPEAVRPIEDVPTRGLL